MMLLVVTTLTTKVLEILLINVPLTMVSFGCFFEVFSHFNLVGRADLVGEKRM